MTGWIVLTGSIIFNVVGNLLVKQFSASTELRSLWDYIALPFILGIVAFGVGVMLYGRALKEIPIVTAYPVQVGTCVLIIALFAVVAFGERIGGAELLGIALIICGIALLARLAG